MLLQGTLTFSLILTAGFLPALLWLWLILKEDRAHPEPRMRLILSFFGGMCAVMAVIPAQYLTSVILGSGVLLIVVIATLEEIAKFVFSYYFALRTKDTDEPVDEIIYMVVVALGFAALENCLFLVAPFIGGNIIEGLVISHARFAGSTLLHVIASGILGISLARAFHKKNKFWAIFIGLTIASALHALYNLLIIQNIVSSISLAFFGIWFIAAVLVYIVNHVKHTTYKNI